jgi:hypothetical protein
MDISLHCWKILLFDLSFSKMKRKSLRDKGRVQYRRVLVRWRQQRIPILVVAFLHRKPLSRTTAVFAVHDEIYKRRLPALISMSSLLRS